MRTHVLLKGMMWVELFLTLPEAALFLASGCSLHEKVLYSITVDQDKLKAICLFNIYVHEATTQKRAIVCPKFDDINVTSYTGYYAF